MFEIEFRNNVIYSTSPQNEIGINLTNLPKLYTEKYNMLMK